MKPKILVKFVKWDWKGTIDIDELNNAVNGIPYPHFYEVDTESDSFCIAVSSEQLNEEDIIKSFNSWGEADFTEEGVFI